jgi:hypothetical protein
MNEIENSVARMRFDENERVLYVTILPGAVMDLPSVTQHFNMMSEITGDEEHYALIDSANPYSITEEALDYVVRPDVLRGRKAAAYFHPDVTNRFQIMQVQIKMKAKIPTYSFKEKDEAMLWLKSLNLVKRASL